MDVSILKVKAIKYPFVFQCYLFTMVKKLFYDFSLKNTKGLTLESLGLRNQALEKVHKNIKRPNGMVLVTGPTGCGKTTTLYTIMDILNEPGV